MKTPEELQQQINTVERNLRKANEDIRQLKERQDTNLAEAERLLKESKLAQEWAKRSFRVDHDGWIWRWDLERKLYVKTSSRINTPVVPCGAIGLRNLDKQLYDIVTSTKAGKTVIVDELPAATEETAKNLYMVRVTIGGEPDYEKFVGVEQDGSYSWLSLGYVRNVTESQLPIEPVQSAQEMWEDILPTVRRYVMLDENKYYVTYKGIAEGFEIPDSQLSDGDVVLLNNGGQGFYFDTYDGYAESFPQAIAVSDNGELVPHYANIGDAYSVGGETYVLTKDGWIPETDDRVFIEYTNE